MREEFLHYLWKFKKFDFLNLKTTTGKEIQLLYSGGHNQQHAGPDFFNAKLKIDGQVWAGNVEIHLKSSDWYAHAHEQDENYDNVILHVVWNHDVEVYRKDNTQIPCLEIKNFTPKNTFNNYQELLSSKEKWVNCENYFAEFSSFKLQNWLERMYIERLEAKSLVILEMLKNSAHNWEAVLFQLLAKNFGLNKNGEAFLSMAQSIPVSIIQKNRNNLQLEALFFGQLNMLQKPVENAYYLQLQKEYNFLKHKYNLPKRAEDVNYFRLRPSNFPTIRLSQLAVLLSSKKSLFSELMKTTSVEKISKLLTTETSEFWKTHYTFEKKSKFSQKSLSQKFINLIFINTFIPLKFCYDKYRGEFELEEIFDLIKSLPTENNSVVEKFNQLRTHTATNALESQALLHLKPNYCDRNQCLQCNLGLQLLQKDKN